MTSARLVANSNKFISMLVHPISIGCHIPLALVLLNVNVRFSQAITIVHTDMAERSFSSWLFLPSGLLISSGNSTPNSHPEIYTAHSKRTLARCVHGRVGTPRRPATAFAVRGALTFSRNRVNIIQTMQVYYIPKPPRKYDLIWSCPASAEPGAPLLSTSIGPSMSPSSSLSTTCSVLHSS